MVIGIIGIGLIGSSLARAFRRHGIGEILVHDNDASHLDEARRLDLGMRYFENAPELAAAADIIFVCVPVGAIAGVVRNIAPALRKGAIVTDTGSVKAEVIKEVKPFLPDGVFFVPGHPLSGTEHSGPGAGRADLFAGRPYVLIEGAAPEAATTQVAALVEKTGAHVQRLDAGRHDSILAFISHLPHLCAFAAMAGSEQASRRAGANVTDYAAQSFRGLTRVAASNAATWKDIFIYNRRHVMEALTLFREQTDRLAALIESDDADGLEAYIAQARALRVVCDTKGESGAGKPEED